MSRQAAKAAHEQLLARIEAATTADELAQVFASVTFLDEPGFSLDLPDGDYHDGAFFGTFRGGQYVVTRTLGWPADGLSDRIIDLWNELEERRRAEAAAERDAERDALDNERAERRGRPIIGRPVQVRLPEWLIQQIDRYADANDITRAETVRKWLVAGHTAIKAGSAR